LAGLVSKRTVAVAMMLAATCLSQVQASDFPTHPIEITVTFAPSGTPDILARALSEGLAADLKQPVVVANKLGAGGAIGAAAVSRARRPDAGESGFIRSRHSDVSTCSPPRNQEG
jgi:tripartite-type tricarboxylate transporter receptor subunit TctC